MSLANLTSPAASGGIEHHAQDIPSSVQEKTYSITSIDHYLFSDATATKSIIKGMSLGAVAGGIIGYILDGPQGVIVYSSMGAMTATTLKIVKDSLYS